MEVVHKGKENLAEIQGISNNKFIQISMIKTILYTFDKNWREYMLLSTIFRARDNVTKEK